MRLIVLIVSGMMILNAQTIQGVPEQSIMESILEETSVDQDVLQRNDELEYLASHQINIAHPSYGELIKLPFVSPLLAESIILLSDSIIITDLEQLKTASLMTPILFEKLIPFITIEHQRDDEKVSDWKQTTLSSRTRIERRIQPVKGIVQNNYFGDQNSSYQRIKYSSSHLEIAGLVEKDAGENYKDGFKAGYVELTNISGGVNMLFGNFNINSSQGLLLAHQSSTLKGINSIGQIQKKLSGIAPTVSTDEFHYFQGAASSLYYENVSFIGFYSSRKLHALIDSSNTVSSFYTTGMFRTPSELNKRARLDERTVGAKLEYHTAGTASVTLTMMNVRYNKDIAPSLFLLQRQRSISAGSIGWEFPVSGFRTFGEIATNDSKNFSAVSGLIISPSRSFSFCYHFRLFSKEYVNPFAHPFGEQNIISNGEIGNYIGIEIKKENTSFNAFVDYFSFPSSDNIYGAEGREAFVSVNYPVSKEFHVAIQVKNKKKSAAEDRIQTNYRIAETFKISPSLVITHRIEMTNVSYHPSSISESGFLTFIDCAYHNQKNGFYSKARLIFFETESFDSRLYQFESDVAGNYSNPPLYGEGIRWYIVAGYDLFNNVRCSFKYSESLKLNETTLGSGEDEIRGNVDNQIALQLDFQL